MAKSSTERHMDWRNRVMLKARIFDDLNAERAARIRQAFPGDERPEVRAVVEFFANYPRCQAAPTEVDFFGNIWIVQTASSNGFEIAAAFVALQETTSLDVVVDGCVPIDSETFTRQVRDEVAEMRALGLWGRP
jgi:hypothetical protein